MQEYHILNGDCLKEKLKDKFPNLLIMREALIQGPTKGNDLDDFLEKRSLFISQEYKACSKEQYLDDTKKELIKIKNIQQDSNINFWFGTDLFCQINFWFLIDFLKDKKTINSLYLVIPQEEENCSFGSNKNIEKSLKKRIEISDQDIRVFVKLWEKFQEEDYASMKKLIKDTMRKYNFLDKTIDALINKSNINETIRKLSKEEKDFKKLYKNFCLLHPIYGYGDIQVEYLLKNLK